MCTRYLTPDVAAIEAYWGLRPGRVPPGWGGPHVDAFRSPVGLFLRAGGELVVGRFGLIPHWSDSPAPKAHTYNARSETASVKPSFRDAWRKGQRCLVPALSFDEPNWETGRNVWWRFARADGAPWGLAGLWNTWIDRASGEVHESYTLLTVNADAHPLMRRMHKPDPKLPPQQQDKRSVVPVERADAAQWLEGDAAQAESLLRLAPAEHFAAGPAEPVAAAPAVPAKAAGRAKARARPAAPSEDPAGRLFD